MTKSETSTGEIVDVLVMLALVGGFVLTTFGHFPMHRFTMLCAFMAATWSFSNQSDE